MKQKLPWIIALLAVGFAVGVFLMQQRTLPESAPPNSSVSTPAPETRPSQTPIVAATPPPVPSQVVQTPKNSATPATQAAAVSGLIHELTGEPVANASVHLSFQESGTPSQIVLYSNAQGRFSAGDLRTTKIDVLTVEAPDHQLLRLSNLEVPIEDLDVTLTRLAVARLHIFYTPESARGTSVPLSGDVMVYMMRRQDSRTSPSSALAQSADVQPGEFVTQTSTRVAVRNGIYEARGLEPGVYRAGVLLGEEYAESEPFAVDTGRDGEARVIIGVRSNLAGFVRMESGRAPIPNAQVVLALASRPMSAGASKPLTATTDQQGRFDFLSLSPGTYALTASANGFTSRTLEQVIVSSQAGHTPEVDCLLSERTAVLTVLVTDGEGRPVPNAPLVLLTTAQTQSRSFFGRTDAAGTCRYRRLQPGRYSLAATLPENSNRQKSVEVVIRGYDAQTQIIRFQKVVKVSGSATVAGQPYQGLLQFQPRGASGGGDYAKTDPAGAYTAELEPGEYVVRRPDTSGSALIQLPAVDSIVRDIQFAAEEENKK